MSDEICQLLLMINNLFGTAVPCTSWNELWLRLRLRLRCSLRNERLFIGFLLISPCSHLSGESGYPLFRRRTSLTLKQVAHVDLTVARCLPYDEEQTTDGSEYKDNGACCLVYAEVLEPTFLAHGRLGGTRLEVEECIDPTPHSDLHCN